MFCGCESWFGAENAIFGHFEAIFWPFFKNFPSLGYSGLPKIKLVIDPHNFAWLSGIRSYNCLQIDQFLPPKMANFLIWPIWDPSTPPKLFKKVAYEAL